MSNALVSLEKPEGRDTNSGRFMAGNKISPGRKIGSKPRLAEKVIAAFTKHFEKNGAKAIETVYNTDPATYLKLAVHMVPRESLIEINAHIDVEMRADIATFAASYTELQSIIGADTIEDAQVIDADIAFTGPLAHA
jgi:hypothetical protein